MKNVNMSLLLVLLITINIEIVNAQNVQLDQSKLLEQFIGNWEGEFPAGEKFNSVNEKFSNGIISKSKILKDDEILDSIIQIYGYDKKDDEIIIAELKESTSLIELCVLKFISETEGEIIVTNPEDAPFRFEFKFKSNDKLVQKAIKNGIVVNEIVLTRKK